MGLAVMCFNCGFHTDSISPCPFRSTFFCTFVESQLPYRPSTRHGSRRVWSPGWLVVTADLNKPWRRNLDFDHSRNYVIYYAVLYGRSSITISYLDASMRDHMAFPGRGSSDSRLFDVCISLFPYIITCADAAAGCVRLSCPCRLQ
jgi:hypothetical protein